MWCNDFISVLFKEKGRDRNGCDCWGLARLIYKEKLNIELPLLLDYDTTKDSKSISKLYDIEHQDWEEIPVGEEKEFDILVFKIVGLPTHVGVVVKKGIMIHCENKRGSHITEYYKDIQWNKRLVGVYRYGRK